MNRFIKLFWFLSMLGFLVGILLIYANLPEEVDVTFGSQSISVELLSRNAFFYAMIAIVALSNGLLLALARAVSLTKTPELAGTDVSDKALFKTRIVNWLGSYSIILNIFYIIGIFFVGFHNDPQYVAPKSYDILAYGSILLLIGWLIWLPFIIFKRNKA